MVFELHQCVMQAKCPMPTVAVASRDGKPALGKQGWRPTGRGVASQGLETNKLEGSLQKTYSVKADVDLKNAGSSAHVNGAVPLTCPVTFETVTLLCSVSPSLKWGQQYSIVGFWSTTDCKMLQEPGLKWQYLFLSCWKSA